MFTPGQSKRVVLRSLGAAIAESTGQAGKSTSDQKFSIVGLDCELLRVQTLPVNRLPRVSRENAGVDPFRL